ncbi:uncharacterized protein LOC115243212 [Formica exsecta]|uniref:uncharacterized protein LOC115243212 n=1 Tax=Formica exsecta TaxID=72781 RepID=UPI0011445688|nr:uncharacterized protein LOC115243212 [Formica exsecta]
MPVDRTLPATPGSASAPEDQQDQHANNMERSAQHTSNELKNSGESGEINANEFRLLKLPIFWHKQPKLWFTQLKSEFLVFRIRSDDIKYSTIIRHLDEQALLIVAEIIERPPEKDKYVNLKNLLINRFTDSDDKRLRQLLAGIELNDKKPLPCRVQATLAVIEGSPLIKLADLADKIMDRESGLQVATITPSTEPCVAKSCDLADLERRISALVVKRSRDSEPGKLDVPLKVETAVNGSPNNRLVITDKYSGLNFLIDTGTDISLVSKRVFKWKFCIASIQRPILGADFLSHYVLLVDMKRRQLIDTITSLTYKEKLSRINHLTVCTTSPDLPFHKILAEFPELTRFAPISNNKIHQVEHHIIVKGSPAASTPRRLSPEKLKFPRDEFNTMMEQGICRPSSSSWATPLHMVPKGGSNSWRLCGDYRALNAATILDRYPLPHIQDFTADLHEKNIFSKIDLVKAYYQVPVAKEDIPKTAVTTSFGLFKFLVMPFGLRNTAQTFQHLMNSILSGLDFCFCYLDDILVASSNESDHFKHLHTVFTRLKQFGYLFGYEPNDQQYRKVDVART